MKKRLQWTSLKNIDRKQLIQLIKNYAHKTGQHFDFNPRRGKGGHGRIQIGGKATTVPDGEMRIGTLHSILQQLGINKKDL